MTETIRKATNGGLKAVVNLYSSLNQSDELRRVRHLVSCTPFHAATLLIEASRRTLTRF